MASPQDYHKFPEPHATAAGRNNPEQSRQPLSEVAKLWRPKNANLEEALAATVSRFTHRIVSEDGRAFTFEELLASEDLASAIGLTPVPRSPGSRADLWDDFHRTDTAFGTITNPPTGQTYDIRYGNSSSNSVRILNNKLVGKSREVYYFGGNMLSEPCFNMGAEVEWFTPPVTTGPQLFTQLTFIIKPDSAWLNSLIHIRISRLACYVEVATSGGAGGLVEIASTVGTNYSTAPFYRAMDGPTAIYEVQISGDNLVLTCDGTSILSVTDARIGAVNGTWVYWESYEGGINDDMRMLKIWANDRRHAGDVGDQRTMPASGFLKSISDGGLNFYRGGTIQKGDVIVSTGNVRADSLQTVLNRAAGGAGIMRASGRLNAASSQPNLGNAAGSGDTNCGSWNSPPYVINENGDRYKVEIYGSFAANGNNKVVKYNWIGGDIFTSGTRTTNGGTWRLVANIWKSSSNNWNFDFEFRDSAGIVTGSLSAATGMNNTLAHQIKLQGVAANDAITRAIFVNVEPN
ncbi:hypothetical protein JIN84_17840 [Luteolibacter yonseiensis]|uniref:Uncharacterized protein n=1 Tax=Luteolibacter yonseiensis TaxID=1144680 RepID=A0A934R6Y6_9BACT|nr:hypothetical protein [Luteolibacter yonseiensis]MBK1817487.1 hypothetical protein [Luteolibacter yonseiensis]